MLKSFFRSMVWKLADSEHMPIRRIGWRLLEFFRRYTEKTHSKKLETGNGVALPIEDLNFLKALYQECARPDPKRTKKNSVQVATNTPIFSADMTTGPSGKVRRLAVFAPSLPKYDRSSSGLRVAQLVKSLPRFADRLTFLYTAKSEFDPQFKKFLPTDVEFSVVAESPNQITDRLIQLGPDVLIITDLFDHNFIALCDEVIERTKKALPTCRVVLDTMDCHWKKYARKALITGNSIDWKSGLKYREVEQKIYPKSDLLTVVTEGDGIDIVHSLEGVPQFSVIPICYELKESLPNFKDTRDLCFVGSATVNHNLDAMRHFRDEIYPHLERMIPGFIIKVIGTGWETVRGEFSGYPFQFLGHAPDLDQVLSQCRLFICPLTYGAGMKGKLGSAASAGIPVVTTSIGSEGYLIRDVQDFIVADEPVEFASACARMLTNATLWEETRNNFRLLVGSMYGYDAMQAAVSQMMQRLLLACPMRVHGEIKDQRAESNL